MTNLAICHDFYHYDFDLIYLNWGCADSKRLNKTAGY